MCVCNFNLTASRALAPAPSSSAFLVGPIGPVPGGPIGPVPGSVSGLPGPKRWTENRKDRTVFPAQAQAMCNYFKIELPGSYFCVSTVPMLGRNIRSRHFFNCQRSRSAPFLFQDAGTWSIAPSSKCVEVGQKPAARISFMFSYSWTNWIPVASFLDVGLERQK